MIETRKHEYKIVHNRAIVPLASRVANTGGWQIKIRQFPDGETGMWYDAGDPCDTRQEAEAKLVEFMDADKGLRRRADGRWEPNET